MKECFYACLCFWVALACLVYGFYLEAVLSVGCGALLIGRVYVLAKDQLDKEDGR